MQKLWKKGALVLATGATLIAAAAPAEAQRYGRGYRGGDRTGAAIAGGVIGLALGAAIASGNRDRYDRGYYGGYRGNGYYGGYNGYVDPYYRGYQRPYRYNRSCYTDRFWDEWRGGWTTVRRCR